MSIDLQVALVSALAAFALGAIGYWVASFWIQPILFYRQVRFEVFSSFIFYADAVIAEGMNNRTQEKRLQRVDLNRRHSADLYACCEVLPIWYRKAINRNHKIEVAARNLIGYANTPDYSDAVKRENAIKKALGFEVSAD